MKTLVAMAFTILLGNAQAAHCACADPVSDSVLNIRDSLFIARTVVGLQTCPLQECDLNGDFLVAVSDILDSLRLAVGSSAIDPNCPITMLFALNGATDAAGLEFDASFPANTLSGDGADVLCNDLSGNDLVAIFRSGDSVGFATIDTDTFDSPLNVMECVTTASPSDVTVSGVLAIDANGDPLAGVSVVAN